MQTTEQRIKAIISNHLGLPEEEIKPENSLVNDLGADSLDIIEIVMAIEDEFSIEISDADVENLTSIRVAVDYIDNHPRLQ